MGRKVGIVGAGLSGLLACKYALSKGYQPLVFESQGSLGGVWTKTFETTKLQTPKPLFQFTDFPWPSSVETLFPDQNQVLDYLQSYANHFDLIKHIRFNTKVLSMKYEGPFSDDEMQSWALWGGNGDPFANNCNWVLSLQDLTTLSTQEVEVDFVILCVGRFSGIPNIPEFPKGKDPDAFQGKVMHSMEYAALDQKSATDLIKGKRVTVVGFQKSALDIAKECSIANGVENPCTVICRTPQWNVPDYMPWGFPLALLYLNRFAEFLLHKPFSLLSLAIAKFVEEDIKKRHKLKKFGMVPDHSFVQAVNTCLVSTVPEGFYEEAEKGSIVLKRSKAWSFHQEGVVLEDIPSHPPINTDLVILATGFKGDEKLKHIFQSPTFQNHIMGSPDSIVPLYRGCIQPRIPQLAVVGFSESLANLYTSEIRCRWLFELMDEKFKLPSIQEMEKDIVKWDKFFKKYSKKYYRRSCVGAVHIWHNDLLCKDMGWNHKRKKGFWAELFEPYGPSDYSQP